MNRQQAEHILDAYVHLRMRGYLVADAVSADEEAADALRGVILDAMTEYRLLPTPVPNVSDNANWPSWNRGTIVTC